MRHCPQLRRGEGLFLFLEHQHTEALASIARQQTSHSLSKSLRVTKQHVGMAVDTRSSHSQEDRYALQNHINT